MGDSGASDEDEAVRRYLQALEARRAAPEGFPDPDTGGPALAGAEMVTGDDREGLEANLSASTPGSRANVLSLENDFVKEAAGYSARHGMPYEAWRRAGVDPDVLARAGIPPPSE